MGITTMFNGAREWLSAAIAPKVETVVNRVDASYPGWIADRSLPLDFDVRNLVDEGYRRNVVIYVCVNELSQAASEPRLVVRDKRTKEPVDQAHPLQQLCDFPGLISGAPDSGDPGRVISKASFMERNVIDLLGAGNNYIHKGRNSAGAVIQLKSLRPDRMTIVPDASGRVKAFAYKAGDARRPQLIDPRDVIHVKYPDPLNDYYGLSPIYVCAKFGDIDNQAADFLRDFFLNGAMPAGIIKLKTSAKPEERKRIQDMWREEFGAAMRVRSGGAVDQSSVSGWHKVAVFNAETEYEELGATPNKIQMDGIWSMSETRICAVFGVHPMVVGMKVGLQHATYSNYGDARRSLWTESIPPITSKYDEGLTAGLAQEFDPNLEIVVDVASVPGLAEDEDKKRDRAREDFKGGIISRNEARKCVGLGPLTDEKSGEEVPDVVVEMVGTRPLTEAGTAKAPLQLGGGAPFGNPALGDGEPGADDPPADDAPPPPPKKDPKAKRPVAPETHAASGQRAAVRRVAERHRPELSRAWASFVASVRDATDQEAVAAAITTDARSAAELVPWSDMLRSSWAPTLERHLLDVAGETRTAVGEALRLTPRERHARKPLDSWIARHVATEVERIDKDGRLAIQAAVSRFVGTGEGDVQRAALQVVREIGLTERQMSALDRAAERLEEAGRTPLQIDRALEKQAEQQMRYRADLIARNEVAEAQAEARREQWAQLREDGDIDEDALKVWNVNGSCCDVCEELDGEAVPIDEEFDDGIDMPPDPHIGCDCEVELMIPRGRK